MGSHTNETDAPQVMPNVPGRGAVELAPGETIEFPDPPPPTETVLARILEGAPVFDQSKATIAEVLAEVGDDRLKAAEALVLEENASKPRKSLIADLAAIAKPEGDD